MRLSALIPSVARETITALESIGIRTDAELLFTPTCEIHRQIGPNRLSRQELTRLYSLVRETAAAEPISAGNLLLQESGYLPRDANLDLQTEHDSIDQLLAGLGGRRILEISGDRTSGKTVRYCSSQTIKYSKTFCTLGARSQHCSEPPAAQFR